MHIASTYEEKREIYFETTTFNSVFGSRFICFPKVINLQSMSLYDLYSKPHQTASPKVGTYTTLAIIKCSRFYGYLSWRCNNFGTQKFGNFRFHARMLNRSYWSLRNGAYKLTYDSSCRIPSNWYICPAQLCRTVGMTACVHL